MTPLDNEMETLLGDMFAARPMHLTLTIPAWPYGLNWLYESVWGDLL